MFNPKEHLVKIKRTNRKTGETITSNYLETKWRVLWFREDHPNWLIDISVTTYPQNLDSTPQAALAMAKIYDENNILRAVEYGYCEKQDFERFIEKAITTAIGRALALLGYGTQWAMEFEDETENIEATSDAPIEDSNTVTQKQISYIHLLLKKKNVSDDKYRKMLAQFNAKSSEELTRQDANKLIEMLAALPDVGASN